jgi:hypothetical protein
MDGKVSRLTQPADLPKFGGPQAGYEKQKIPGGTGHGLQQS